MPQVALRFGGLDVWFGLVWIGLDWIVLVVKGSRFPFALQQLPERPGGGGGWAAVFVEATPFRGVLAKGRFPNLFGGEKTTAHTHRNRNTQRNTAREATLGTVSSPRPDPKSLDDTKGKPPNPTKPKSLQ